MKNLFTGSLLMLLSLLFVTSCSSKKEEEEGPAPKSKTELNRLFTFESEFVNGTDEAKYGDPYVNSKIELSNGNLEADFSTPFPVGRDNISFTLAQSKLTASYIGTYPLKSLPNPAVGTASVQYAYIRDVNASSLFSSVTNSMEGEFIITAYNSKSKLISGNYAVTLKKVYDPTYYFLDLDDVDKCTIEVTGKFENIKISN